MGNILLVVHVLIAFAIIGLILIQQGKGAEMGASFGSGASQTLFGSGGSGNFFSKLTAIFVAVFFVTSFSLALISKNSVTVEDDIILPELEQVDPTAEGSVIDLPADLENESASDAVVPDLGSGSSDASEPAAAEEDSVPEIPAN